MTSVAAQHAALPRADADDPERAPLTIRLPNPGAGAPLGPPTPDAASAAAALMAFAPPPPPPSIELPSAASLPAPPAGPAARHMPKGSIAPFIRTVFELVNSPVETYCEWAEGGRRIVFTDPAKFAEVTCPLHFRHSNWTSFSRMMNMYDFRKITRKPRKAQETRSVIPIVFEHDHFREGGEAFLHLIIRRKRAVPGEDRGPPGLPRDHERHAMAEMQQKVVALEIENSYLRSMLAQQHAAHAGYAQAPPGYPGAPAGAPGYPYAAAPPTHGYPYAPAAAPMQAYGYPAAPPQTLQSYPFPPEGAPPGSYPFPPEAAPLGYPPAAAAHEPPPTPQGQPPGKKSRSASEDDVSPKTARTAGPAPVAAMPFPEEDQGGGTF